MSFFERLEIDAPLLSVIQGPDPIDFLESIKRNISNLLNTRIGESLSSPELGLTDFNDAVMNSRDLAFHIRWGIKHCLTRYEPRICDMDIRVIPDTSSLIGLRFHIVASIDLGAFQKEVQFDLLLDSNKKYRVI